MNAAHGEFSIESQQNIIIVRLSGMFNREGSQAYTKAVKSLVNKRSSSEPFAMLIDDMQIEGGTPEAYAELDQYNHWLNAQPLAAKAFLIDSEVKKQIILQRAPELLKQNIAFFTLEDDAIAWLTSQLGD